MGIDGRNTLFVRGRKEILDQLETSGCILETSDTDLRAIAENFFGPNHIKVVHRAPTYLVIDYYYRNEPVYQYLTALLAANPTCWFKNTYITDDGSCGLWIGRWSQRDDTASIQEIDWNELCEEEIMFETDFSRNQ
jgi:hypothetical protein